MESALHIRLDDGTLIRMQTQLVHAETDRLRFRCLSVDIASMGHLRRLVELNLADPKLLDRELEALG